MKGKGQWSRTKRRFAGRGANRRDQVKIILPQYQWSWQGEKETDDGGFLELKKRSLPN